MKLLAAALLLLPQLAFTQSMERGMFTVPTRSGVTQSFFVAGMGDVKPLAVAIVYTGGWGTLNLRQEGGQVRSACWPLAQPAWQCRPPRIESNDRGGGATVSGSPGRPYEQRPTDLFRSFLVTSGAMTKRLARLQDA